MSSSRSSGLTWFRAMRPVSMNTLDASRGGGAPAAWPGASARETGAFCEAVAGARTVGPEGCWDFASSAPSTTLRA